MIRKIYQMIFMFLVLFATGCIKETYDMNKLSEQVQFSPTMAISAIKGDISFSDMVKSNDTVVFDQNKFVKLVFKKDKLIDLKMADFYDLNNMVSFSQSYTLGDLSLADFQCTMGYTLNQISAIFSPVLRAQLVTLDNGGLYPFPAFPSTNLGEKTFTGITNFENAVFRSGFLDISITNNLTAPLNSINISLFNTTGHSAIGSTVTIPPVAPGETQTGSIDLTDKTVTNSIIAAIVLSGSSGNTTPVLISLNNSNISVTIKGRDLKIKSGKVILPVQTISSLDNKDTVSFDPGSGVELTELKITTGNLSYHLESGSPLGASLTISMPSALRNGIPLVETINVGPASQVDDSIPFSNTVVNLATDLLQPYNRVPVSYSITVNSGTAMINFNSTDKVELDMKLLNPVFDYAKGYFGQQVETIDPDSIDLEIKDILSHITGDFLISSPSIKLNYSNSFAIPIQLTLNAAGKRKAKVVNLGLAPVTLSFPVAPANRDVSATFAIDKSNSSLPALISMPPEEIRFSGSAKMNPSGDVTHLRNNYIFGNSRFLGDLEIEVPMEFKINNLQYADTVDNFMKDDGTGGDSPVKPEDFELVRIDIAARNGFPLGVSLKMSLYDSVTRTVKSTVDATGILDPAPTDSNGKVTDVAETGTSIEFTKDFFSSVTKADKVIFYFTLNTTDNGSKDVKIYSDYRIDFSAALVIKPVIKLK